MSWVLTTLNRQLRQARELECEQARRLNEAYACWLKKHRERKSRDREQERRLLGTHDHEYNDRREG